MIALNHKNFLPTKVKLTNACRRRLCRSGDYSDRALLLITIEHTGEAYYHSSICAKVYWRNRCFCITYFEYKDLEEVK
jgi:hypothetical protein